MKDSGLGRWISESCLIVVVVVDEALVVVDGFLLTGVGVGFSAGSIGSDSDSESTSTTEDASSFSSLALVTGAGAGAASTALEGAAAEDGVASTTSVSFSSLLTSGGGLLITFLTFHDRFFCMPGDPTQSSGRLFTDVGVGVHFLAGSFFLRPPYPTGSEPGRYSSIRLVDPSCPAVLKDAGLGLWISSDIVSFIEYFVEKVCFQSGVVWYDAGVLKSVLMIREKCQSFY